MIDVTVIKDEEERLVEVLRELQAIMDLEPDVLNFWNSLSFSVKMKFTQSITSAKKEETRTKRVEAAIEKLRHKEKM